MSYASDRQPMAHVSNFHICIILVAGDKFFIFISLLSIRQEDTGAITLLIDKYLRLIKNMILLSLLFYYFFCSNILYFILTKNILLKLWITIFSNFDL